MSNFQGKIYTRTGDTGQASLGNGERLSKADPVFEALGDLDELSSYLGLVRTYLNIPHNKFIKDIQKELFLFMAVISGSNKDLEVETWTKNLEAEIDKLQRELPPLHNFVIPGGSIASAHIHVARAVCRRAERKVAFIQQFVDCQLVLKPLNRLSDYLFILARVYNESEELLK